MPIRVLSEALASRIAAGEVIERPASVVKELVENALDAGSTRVDVEVRDGGIRSIRVVDNGRGIPHGELALAFERFATSKIDESSDLLGIETLGFRGEALPSVAAVARVEAVSRAGGSDRAERCLLEFGKRLGLEPAGAAPGTSVLVTRLFRNVPARLKFLGSPGTELGRVQQAVSTYALVCPHVAFRLVSDGRVRLSTPGSGDPLQAVTAVYGRRVAGAMLPLPEDEEAAFGVAGLASDPTISRGNRTYVTLAVNGRPVQSRRLAFAVEQAYHGFLPDRRFPVAVLYIRVPYHDVDVNVHPAKTEVRFLREDLVFAQVQRAVRAALVEGSPVPAIAPARFAAPGSRPQTTPASGGRFDAPPDAFWPAYREPDHPRAGSRGGVPVNIEGEPAAPEAGRTVPKSALPVLRVIGQARETYILAEGPDGVYLIDQHAAHERVLYEDLRQRMLSRRVEAQTLLVPVSVELTPEHARTLERLGETLADAGFSLEPFGEGAVLLRAVPQMLASSDAGAPGEALLRILDEVGEGGSAEAWRERLLHAVACHSAVRAGRRMTVEESRELVQRLERTPQPHTCPHGRPTMVHLSAGALEREFRRS